MLKKLALLVVLLGFGGVLINLGYRSYVEASIQEASFPLSETLEAEFETKLDAEYKIVIAFRESDGLKRARVETTGGDAYERSGNLGRYVLKGIKIDLVGMTESVTGFKEGFSIFGGAPAYENTSLEWDPHASYQFATFQGQAGKRFRLTVTQAHGTANASNPVPAYVMVRKS